MTCQRCTDEASVHVTESVDGQVRELHLCEACARKYGIPIPEADPGTVIELMIQKMIHTQVGERIGELAKACCPYCGMRFMEFRSETRLGCPHDYGIFRQGLEPLLQKHHGATRHVGKRPRRVGETSEKILGLRAQLRRAIAREDYELAARLRDQLRHEEV
jgi:protein arginine kinase activator